MPDHVHIFVGLKPSMAISDLVRDIKNNSSKFINERNWLRYKFEWQTGYGVFSYSKSHIGNVYNYIQNQERHHQSIKFRDEYIQFLKEHEIEFQDQYVFDWIN